MNRRSARPPTPSVQASVRAQTKTICVRSRCAVGAMCRSVQATSSPGASPGTDQGCHGRGVSTRSAIMRQYQLIRWRGDGSLAWNAGPDLRSGRPPSSTFLEVETYVQRNRNPSVPGRHARRSGRRPAAARRRDALALQGARRRSVAGRAAGDDAGARPLLGDRLRLARVRGETERAAAVHDRDRRGGHPLHPREVAARGRVAADHDARLARLGHRAARGRRPAHRPDRARRTRRGRVRPRAAVPARLRLLRRADRDRLEPRPHRARLGGADAPPRLHPLRRPGRRRGRLGHRRDGPPGTRGAGSAST